MDCFNSAGWFKCHRILRNKRIWRDSSSDRKVLLITLLMMAAYTETNAKLGKVVVTLHPGELISSYNELADECEISQSVVRKGLAAFQEEGFLTYETYARGLKITITNWDRYQGDPETTASEPVAAVSASEPRPEANSTTRVKAKKPGTQKPVENADFVSEVISYLNDKAGKSFEVDTKGTISLINKQLKKGRTLDDFRLVIDLKVEEWSHGDMRKYLRPSTLFADEHFSEYLSNARDRYGVGAEQQPATNTTANTFFQDDIPLQSGGGRFTGWQ